MASARRDVRRRRSTITRAAQQSRRIQGRNEHESSAGACDRYAMDEQQIPRVSLRSDRARSWCAAKDRGPCRTTAAIYPRKAAIETAKALAGTEFHCNLWFVIWSRLESYGTY